MGCKILGVGGYLPGKPLLNNDLSNFFDVNDDWIQARTGIKQRYFTDDAASVMAYHSANLAILDAKIDKNSLDLVVVASTTPDNAFPSIATKLQGMLALESVPSFDINAVCSGFVYALNVVHAMMQSGNYNRVLLVGVDKMSSVLDMKDRSTAILFGDGAGAVVLEKSDDLFDGYIGSDGRFADILGTKKSENGAEKIFMNGKEVYKMAVSKMVEISQNLLAKNNISVKDLDHFIPHQANLRIIEAVSEKLGIEEKKVATTVSIHANTSSATIPLALNEIKNNGKLSEGDLVLMVAIGAGLTYGGVLFKV